MVHPVAAFGWLTAEFYSRHGVANSSTFVNPQGLRIFTQYWVPSGVAPILGTVAVIHGFIDESSWMVQLTAAHFAKARFAVDHQGHGFSEGLQGHIPDIGPMLDDCEAAFAPFRADYPPPLPCFLYGESLGGAIALQGAASVAEVSGRPWPEQVRGRRGRRRHRQICPKWQMIKWRMKDVEEEQIKRLERLKQERQKRIAARSSTSNSLSTSQQAKAKPSPKISPSTNNSSKFNDAEPGSSSPLRKLPARTTPGSDPRKTSKVSKLSDSTNAVSKSTSSLAEIKKEKSGRSESSSERLKKLAEPKSNASTDRPSNSKPGSVDHSRRRSMPEDTQTKKISAIMQLDQSKSATLPELKVKSPRAPTAIVKNKTESTDGKKANAKAPSISESSQSTDGKKANGKISRISNSDDNVVVEKTVVMLENEVVSTPPVILPPGRIVAENETSSDDRLEKPSLELEYTAIRAPPSPVVLPGAENPTIHRPDDQVNSYEVVSEYQKDEPEKPTFAAVEKPYQAPFARVTSLENAPANRPAYPDPLPVQESETLVRAESIRARVPDPVYTVSVEETREANEKPRCKESKGFRKLLKFGRKSHTSALANGTMDSDASSVDEATAGDGSMLKNLISQDDSGSSSKASRSFSLLSPFRSKQKVIVL